MNIVCAFKEMIAVAKLKLLLNPRNANKHPPEQIDRLAEIIKYQGQRSPIVISKRSGFIVKGHGRLMAIEKLGWSEAAVDWQEYESEAQEYADMVADNEIARWAELDVDKLIADMKQMEIENIVLPDIDFLGLENNDILAKHLTGIGQGSGQGGGMNDENKFIVAVELKNEAHQQGLYEELTKRGFECKLMS